MNTYLARFGVAPKQKPHWARMVKLSLQCVGMSFRHHKQLKAWLRRGVDHSTYVVALTPTGANITLPGSRAPLVTFVILT